MNREIKYGILSDDIQLHRENLFAIYIYRLATSTMLNTAQLSARDTKTRPAKGIEIVSLFPRMQLGLRIYQDELAI